MHFARISTAAALGLISACAANAHVPIVNQCPAGPPPAWAGLPVTAGQRDTTLQTGTGGIALRAIDGGTGMPIDGGHLSVTPDTLLTSSPRWLSAVSNGGRAAVIRNIHPGRYWLFYQRIGYQTFATEATVTTGRVDTLSVTLYYVAVCLSQIRLARFATGLGLHSGWASNGPGEAVNRPPFDYQ